MWEFRVTITKSNKDSSFGASFSKFTSVSFLNRVSFILWFRSHNASMLHPIGLNEMALFELLAPTNVYYFSTNYDFYSKVWSFDFRLFFSFFFSLLFRSSFVSDVLRLFYKYFGLFCVKTRWWFWEILDSWGDSGRLCGSRLTLRLKCWNIVSIAWFGLRLLSPSCGASDITSHPPECPRDRPPFWLSTQRKESNPSNTKIFNKNAKVFSAWFVHKHNLPAAHKFSSNSIRTVRVAFAVPPQFVQFMCFCGCCVSVCVCVCVCRVLLHGMRLTEAAKNAVATDGSGDEHRLKQLPDNWSAGTSSKAKWCQFLARVLHQMSIFSDKSRFTSSIWLIV